jgi:hypothetical protein|tara:strand:+ start:3117 stop:3449 length:333 start_codon:yes stop_codon:yes gene_type:complete
MISLKYIIISPKDNMDKIIFNWYSHGRYINGKGWVPHNAGRAHIPHYFKAGVESTSEGGGADDTYVAYCGIYLHTPNGTNTKLDSGTIEEVIKAGAEICPDCTKYAKDNI